MAYVFSRNGKKIAGSWIFWIYVGLFTFAERFADYVAGEPFDYAGILFLAALFVLWHQYLRDIPEQLESVTCVNDCLIIKYSAKHYCEVKVIMPISHLIDIKRSILTSKPTIVSGLNSVTLPFPITLKDFLSLKDFIEKLNITIRSIQPT